MTTVDVQTDPTLHDWLSTVFGVNYLEFVDGQSLTALALASRREDVTHIPPDVMVGWRRLLDRQQRVVDQSEHAYIERVRTEGASWERVAGEIEQDGAAAAEARYAELSRKLTEPPQIDRT